jgi:uncharacterized protein (TIGR01777 family)
MNGELPRSIVVSGASGLIGGTLCESLAARGCEVRKLVRNRAAKQGEIRWDPDRGEIDSALLAGVEGVVHLAGENIGDGRWTAEKKRRIRDSRVQGTRLLCDALAAMPSPPRVLIAGSAIGYYGSRGDLPLDEESSPGNDFLANVCQEWEAAAESARAAGIRVVKLRTGVVLSTKGGALAKMLFPFKLGVGGVVGDGRQYMSWITLEDEVRVIEHALAADSLSGPLNSVSPNPVTNREFTKTLGRVLGRPTIFPMPAFAARLAFGEMADALLLSSTRVVPKQLAQAGFAFKQPELEAALSDVIAAK